MAPIDPLGPLPLRGSLTFSDDAQTFFTQLPAFVEQVNALGVQYEADAAVLAANTPLVIAAANFKGPWSSLSGPLVAPASVWHDGAYWVPVSDLSDVSAKTPGVDPEWLLIYPLGGYIDADAMIYGAGDYYIDTESGQLTATLPSIAREGTAVTLIDPSYSWETNNAIIARNGRTINGENENLILDVSGIQITLILKGNNWRLV